MHRKWVLGSGILGLAVILTSCIGLQYPRSIQLQPNQAVIAPGDSLQLTVSPSVETTSLQWTVSAFKASAAVPSQAVSANVSAPAVGYVTPQGVYVAPTNIQQAVTVSIVANVKNQTSLTATAQVVVAPIVAQADFGNRVGSRFEIPNNLFGSQHANFGALEGQALQILHDGGMRTWRLDANLATVFRTPTPDWTVIDPLLQELQSAGMEPIITLDYTPLWLTPTPNLCIARNLSPDHAPPTNNQAWAQVAAEFVHHVNTRFPGLVKYYEIWNEPDGYWFLCTPEDTGASRMQAYIPLYAAAGAAIRAQATADGADVRIGGPDTADAWWALQFLGTMLKDPTTAPYVDFVSYHNYGVAGPDAKFDWDTTDPSLLSSTRNPDWGFAAWFKKISALVRSGNQPNPLKTEILLTEYNTWPDKPSDCCRNSPTYSPLWNATVVSDLLNTVYDGAQSVPARMVYYGANNQWGSCLLGTAGSNCFGADQTSPYPQFELYTLLSSKKFLNLEDGGYMAFASSSSLSNVLMTAFYNQTGDAILITNTSATAYPGVAIAVLNSGQIASQATLYTLNADNQQIGQIPLATYSGQNGLLMVIDIPARSVVAIKLPAQSGP